jgi:uncharacterized membrane protein YccC
LIVNLLASPACCGSATLTLVQQMTYGATAALTITLIAAAFASLVSRRPTWVLLTVGVIIALFVGLLLGPVAYALPHPMLAMFVCALLGAALAILLCWLWCARGRDAVNAH